MESILTGVMSTFGDPLCLVLLLIGTIVGLAFGSLPGLTAHMGVALLIPVSYTLDTIPSFGLLLGCYIGGVSGGAISACLLNIPGTPSAICTTLDGYPLTQKGEAAKALGWAASASGVGTIISWVMLVVFSTIIANFCKNFSSAEYAAIALLGLLMVASMSKKDITRGIVTALIGVFLSTIGIDAIYGNSRLTFGNNTLMSGFNTVAVSIGAFAIPHIISMFVNPVDYPQPKMKAVGFLPTPRELWRHRKTIIRSSFIGTIIGVIPAIGQATAAFFAYDFAKKSKSHDNTEFGKGNIDGVIAPETANNSVCGGAMVPMLTLGIPGDPTTAILIAGLTLHGLRPGAALFRDNYDVVVGIYCCLLIATLLMVLVQTFGIKLFCRLLSVPTRYLAPILLTVCMVGCYATRNNTFDCVVCIVIGIVCYFLDRAGYNGTCIVMGLVLGSTFESEFRRALVSTDNDWTIFISRPISAAILLISIVALVLFIRRQELGKKRVA